MASKSDGEAASRAAKKAGNQRKSTPVYGIPVWSHFASSVSAPLPSVSSDGERGMIGHPKFCGLDALGHCR